MKLKDFVEPKMILRPAPFWAINDKLEPEEAARQLADMIDKGFSGAFFHSRAGLITEYLGDEWFDAVRASIQAAKAHNGYLWLYDEDLWPSGNVGGLIAGTSDEYRSTYIEPELVPAGEEPFAAGGGAEIAAYELRGRSGTTIQSAEQVSFEEARRSIRAERLLFRRFYEPKTPWWGWESHPNLLHPDVTRKFIELTHEVYLKQVGQHFGNLVPGIFTDEPHLDSRQNALPWHEDIPGVYAERTGRDFFADLPYAFLDGREARRIRLLVYRTILWMFCDRFSRPLGEWCERNGLEFTGHYNAEDTLLSQLNSNCGGAAAHYRYQQLPGIDHLRKETLPLLLTTKQALSAARQLGRRGVLTEIFGVSRYTCTFEDYKRTGDFDLVHGATFFVPHLSWYSMRGKRKRDYPPNINYQETYWDHMKPLNDYFTRCAAVLTSGQPVVEVLLLHPIEDASAGYRRSLVTGKRPLPPGAAAGGTTYVTEVDRVFRTLLAAALNAGYDADLGDEGYIEDLGSVKDGRFVVGKMSYSVVVVPEAKSWRRKTLDLLVRFVQEGGTVVVTGRTPDEVDCLPAADEWAKLAASEGVLCIPANPHELQQALDRTVRAGYTLKGSDGAAVPDLYVHVRESGGKRFFFAVNSSTSDTRTIRLTVFAAAGKHAETWDPLTGEVFAAATRKSGKDLVYETALPPAGSVLFVLGGKKQRKRRKPAQCPREGKVVPLPGPYDFHRTEDNVLVLDRIEYSLDGGRTFSPQDMEHRIRREIAEHFALAGFLGCQPWAVLRKKATEGLGGEVILRYRFHNAAEEVARAAFVVEDFAKGTLTVNGNVVESSGSEWQWDRSFEKVDITESIVSGENVVDFRMNYSLLSEVERAYVVGDFGVRLRSSAEGELCAEPEKLEAGSWVSQGFPFYPGGIVYETKFRHTRKKGLRTFLRLLNPSGILYVVRVNGDPVGKILWRPFELDLTKHLKNGRNLLEIEVAGSNQNAHGPLHLREGDSFVWQGPNAFTTDSGLMEKFTLFDYGLLSGAELVMGK